MEWLIVPTILRFVIWYSQIHLKKNGGMGREPLNCVRSSWIDLPWRSHSATTQCFESVSPLVSMSIGQSFSPRIRVLTNTKIKNLGLGYPVFTQIHSAVDRKLGYHMHLHGGPQFTDIYSIDIFGCYLSDGINHGFFPPWELRRCPPP